MRQPPVIIVQLVHIHGPMKGEIQEFSQGIISIGRHPSSDLKFPADLTIVSRSHAEIIRDGNQFRLADRSTNGTFVNGKRITEALLRDGDVLEFADGGPKVSFLTQMKEVSAEAEIAPPPAQEPAVGPAKKPFEKPIPPQEFELPRPEQRPSAEAPRQAPPEVSIQPATVPLVIQYGATIRSYKELPITIGKSSKCQFVLNEPAIYDQHAQVFFTQNQYWIKDLTGQKLVQINRQPIPFQAPLTLYDNISLSSQGPVFRFLGEGRLAEVTEPAAEEPSPSIEKKDAGTKPGDARDEKPQKGVLSRIKKLF
jgi:pSer/pThr/pTyr-binding forkhead associated (FHA) protein